jgi:type VII secretion protein EccB
MPSRQDQLHSYQFMIQRVVAALVMRETDPAQSPFRRAMGATLASVLIAAIALGGVAVYAMIRGFGAKTNQNEAAVLLEKETGATFVRRDGKLHPMLNLTSAMLVAGTSNTRNVSRSSLEGEARGLTLGIPNAPDSLPAPKRLLTDPWTVCSTVQGDNVTTRSVLSVGKRATTGRPLGDKAIVARQPDGQLYLVWHNRRYVMSDAETLRFPDTANAVPVSPAVLNNLDEGVPIARIRLDRQGQQSAALRGHQIGEVIVKRDDVDDQKDDRLFGVVLDAGLAPITDMEAQLLINDPQYAAFAGRKEMTELQPAEFNGLRATNRLAPRNDTALPASTPDIVDGRAGGICATADGKGVNEVRVGVAVPDGPSDTAGRTGPGGVLADHIDIDGGRGALVQAVASPGATGGAVLLVTDLGWQYALADPVKGREVLGYGKVTPVQIPAGLVRLIPEGAALDQEAALRTVAR